MVNRCKDRTYSQINQVQSRETHANEIVLLLFGFDVNGKYTVRSTAFRVHVGGTNSPILGSSFENIEGFASTCNDFLFQIFDVNTMFDVFSNV